MDYVSSVEASDSEELTSEAQVASVEAQILLALEAVPVNFSAEEIQPIHLRVAVLQKQGRTLLEILMLES
jgi:hypothetical protein